MNSFNSLLRQPLQWQLVVAHCQCAKNCVLFRSCQTFRPSYKTVFQQPCRGSTCWRTSPVAVFVLRFCPVSSRFTYLLNCRSCDEHSYFHPTFHNTQNLPHLNQDKLCALCVCGYRFPVLTGKLLVSLQQELLSETRLIQSVSAAYVLTTTPNIKSSKHKHIFVWTEIYQMRSRNFEKCYHLIF